ncbi:MAG: tRNA (adenosine(37)-N6)-dimethylallyltransferase MiaA [Deltaproteobacteria bacterium]|nr:tRNA (adenosine(37)-N6)-dimethylallyltransferase MiaA [Deltaproteobacteria bacterium]
MSRPKVAVLVGPTAAGKTAVAVGLALNLGAEIVNADSLQVYRELDIGTAKPTLEERALVRHHLVDIVNPDEPYDAARYSRDARRAVADLVGRGVPPLVAGGTGLYIKALLHGLFSEGDVSPDTRARLRQELSTEGLAGLYERLGRVDPETARRLPPGDTYRILRALEVAASAGRPMSALLKEHRFRDSPYSVLKIGLNLPRQELYARIERRVDEMLAAGWLAEVEQLLRRYGAHIKPLKSLGYRHLIAYLQGDMGWDKALAQIKQDTRRYAKRQLTWFRGDPEVSWFHPEQSREMLALLEDFFGRR